MNFKKRLIVFLVSLLITLAIFLFIPESKVIDLPNSDNNNLQFLSVRSTPDVVRVIYLTNYSAASQAKIDEIIEMAENNEINSVVIDIKDWSGYIFYETKISQAEKYNSKKIIIRDIAKLIEKLHQHDIYTIARVVVFQDPVLAKARPEIAVQKISDQSSLWLDNHGLAWIDPASQEAWDYNIDLALEALDLGFDEINFDYIRFPSDGRLREMAFPIWDKTISKRDVIKTFFRYLRQRMSRAIISADLFGYTTVNRDDLNIGQVIEDAFPYFDFICPMVYPSHYNRGFIGIDRPAEHPYQVVNYSMKATLERLNFFNQEKEMKIKTGLRPWLQDFNLGATYDTRMVRDQIQATEDALEEDYVGFILWNPRNIYTREALR